MMFILVRVEHRANTFHSRDVATGAEWVISNCNAGGRVGGKPFRTEMTHCSRNFLEGSAAAGGNGNLIVSVDNSNWF